MAHFVAVDDGFLNLDHIAKIERARVGTALLFFGTDGLIAGRINQPYGNDPELLACSVIAAAPETTAVLIYAFNEEYGACPDQTFIETTPVVAWRLAFEGALPVLIEAPGDDATVFIRLPGGQLLLPDVATFPHLAAAREHVLSASKRRWEDRQQRRDISANKPGSGLHPVVSAA